MKLIPLIGSLIFVSLGTADAKDCDCEQHSAGASGSGTCSLTESSSRCSIVYSAATNQERLEGAQELLAQYNIGVLPHRTFETLNLTEPGAISIGMFRDLVLGAFALSDPDQEMEFDVHDFAHAYGISQPGFSFGDNFERLHRKFQYDGCIEVRDGESRFLLISRFSRFDKHCPG